MSSELDFISTDAGEIYNFIMYTLENGVAETLYPGDERLLFAEALVPFIVSLYNTLNDSARQVTLRYARGEVLDALGEFAGVTRISETPAETVLRFSLSSPITENIIIKTGTRVTGDYTRYFATTETVVLQAGSTHVDVNAESTAGGSDYNEIAEGSINILVDQIPYIDSVSNVSVTSKGGDKEDDDEYRERIRLSPSSRSVAGPKNSYKYFAISADASIADATVSSPSPGVVLITPILYGGGIPEQSILDKVLEACSADDIRPLTDNVQVQAPSVEMYDIELVYYTTSANEAEAIVNIEGSNGAINKYIYWQGSALQRDINPDHLRKLILSPIDDDGNGLIGADRVEIISPAYKELDETTVAKYSGTLNVSHVVKG